jgi:succinoglycan biosynthesis protein ExoA
MSTLPFVSVIMPVFNEASYLERSLGAVLKQDYPLDRMEVLVSDGMSNDGTREIVQRLSHSEGRSVMLIDNPQHIVPTAMNAAIKKAKGEILIRIDGHSLPDTQYVRKCVEYLMQSKADCVGGATTSVGETYTGKAIALAVSSPFGAGSSPFRTGTNHSGPKRFETLQYPAFLRNVFDRVGLFNERMVRHQDYELHYRIRKIGGKILLYPDLKVQYFVRKSLASLWKQYWQYGLWKGRFLRLHPDSVKIRHAIPALFVLSLIVPLVLALFFPPSAQLTVMLFTVYLFYLLLMTLLFTLRGHGKFAPILPIVFATLHFSYGTAMWIGLFSKVQHLAYSQQEYT